jgi:hypothetical protein
MNVSQFQACEAGDSVKPGVERVFEQTPRKVEEVKNQAHEMGDNVSLATAANFAGSLPTDSQSWGCAHKASLTPGFMLPPTWWAKNISYRSKLWADKL